MSSTWNISIFNNLGENKEKHDIQQLEHIFLKWKHIKTNKKNQQVQDQSFRKRELGVDEPGKNGKL